MTRNLMIGTGFVLSALGIVILGTTATAQVKQGKTRPAETKYLMRGIVKPNCAGLGKLLKASGPADEKAWDTAACHAACLNEVGHLLMADGRCPDGKWAGASKTLQSESAAVLAACKKQDLKAASAAFKKMTQSCAACHKAHKK